MVENIEGKAEKAFSPYPVMFSKVQPTRALNSLPNDKISDWSKLKAFADENSKYR